MAVGSMLNRTCGLSIAEVAQASNVGGHVESDQVDIVGWAIGHDRGRVVSPLLVEGQVLGPIAHGLSNALCEEARAADGATPAA